MAVGHDGEVRPLTQQELETTEFAHLMWLASGAETEKLERLIRDVPSEYLVHGVTECGRVVALVAFGPNADPVVVRYIAVAETGQRQGLGRALVSAVQHRAAGRSVGLMHDLRQVGYAAVMAGDFIIVSYSTGVNRPRRTCRRRR